MSGREIDLEVVAEAYLESAAFAETAHTGEGDEDDESPLDTVMAERDIDWHDDAKKYATQVCADFVSLAREICGEEVFERFDDEQIGHDFWLTTRRHGAGFWDRDIEPEGKRLSDEVCVLFNESNYPYVGDDDAAHFEDELTYKKPDRKKE